MAGIYIHIPFCRQACHYCDFHFSTSSRGWEELLAAMHKELELRADYLEGKPIETIYFGGGTPSLLEADELKKLLDRIQTLHNVSPNAEITLEANPDDLLIPKLRALKDSPINRLSIGIQSFRDADLQWMNRAHTSQQADYSVKAAQDHGFENITVDLIYSIPNMGLQAWKQNLLQAFALNIQHISAYSLTIEPKTFFGTQKRKGIFTETDEQQSSDQFLLMLDEMQAHGFEQYEVSNFCTPGFESRHNSSYWKGSHYLGIGPSAHSFNGQSRQWNVANNALYTKSLLQENKPHFELETLTDEMRLNEYIMTGLRTKWGISVPYIRKEFGVDLLKEYEEMIEDLKHQGKLVIEDEVIRLTRTGLLAADGIASDFFVAT